MEVPKIITIIKRIVLVNHILKLEVMMSARGGKYVGLRLYKFNKIIGAQLNCRSTHEEMKCR